MSTLGGMMKVETIRHKTGDLLPLLLDDDHLPIPAPNEFIISRWNQMIDQDYGMFYKLTSPYKTYQQTQ